MKRKAVRDDDRVLDRFEDRSTAIVIERGAKIPARNGTGAKGSSGGWFLVKQEFRSWWGERCLIEVESTVKMVVGREMGMKTGRTKEVEGEDCLRK